MVINMGNIFLRTEALFGKDAMEKLKNSSVIVFGIGGVGGHTAEALVRSGVGKITLVDKDVFDETNLNRQIFSTVDAIGKSKTEIAEKRLKNINPDCAIKRFDIFYLPETSHLINLKEYDYVVDAIDTVTGKIEIITNAKKADIPVISSMGTGNKFDPSRLKIADIYKTDICPLARVMRREMKKRNIKSLTVVYSDEKPVESVKDNSGNRLTASNAFVPSTAGILIASHVVYEIINNR